MLEFVVTIPNIGVMVLSAYPPVHVQSSLLWNLYKLFTKTDTPKILKIVGSYAF